MSLDPVTPHRHSLRDSAHRGVCLPIGVCLCMCVYLILLPVPSGAWVRACPAAAAQCEFLPTQQPPPSLHTLPNSVFAAEQGRLF